MAIQHDIVASCEFVLARFIDSQYEIPSYKAKLTNLRNILTSFVIEGSLSNKGCNSLERTGNAISIASQEFICSKERDWLEITISWLIEYNELMTLSLCV